MSEYEALCERRAARAGELADGDTGAREALRFYARIAAFQAVVPVDEPASAFARLGGLLSTAAPMPLRQALAGLSDAQVRQGFDDYLGGGDAASPIGFAARVLLGPTAAAGRLAERVPDRPTVNGPDAGSLRCPRCGQRPQVGCLRPQGHGAALSYVCSLCLFEWAARRDTCPACEQHDASRLTWYRPQAGTLEGIQLRACEACRRYLQVIDLERAPTAVPDVDEIAALALDVWAASQGYVKLQPNLIGI